MANEYLDRLLAEQQAGASAPAGNPYLDRMISEAGDSQFRASVSSALDTDPEKAALAKRVAGYLGTPPAAVAALPEEAKRAAQLKQISEDSAQAPALRQMYTDADFAKLAHDDSSNLAQIEKTIASITKYLMGADGGGGLPGDLGAGVMRANRGAAGVFQAGADVFGLRGISAQMAEAGAMSEANAKALSGPKEGVIASGVSSGVQSLASNLLMMPLALLPGGQPAALAAMSSGAGGQAYQQAREKGLSTIEALPFAASQGVIEFATERIPLGRLIGDLKAGAPLLKTVMRQAATEIPGEQVATVLQDLNEWAVLNPEKPFSAYLEERPSAAAQTLIATLIGVGGQTTIMRGIQKAVDSATGTQRGAQQADVQAQAIEQFNALAAASKVLERDPETFATFIEQATAEGPVQDVYISADALAQSGAADQVIAASPAVEQQFAAALETGADIRIPVAEYASTIAGQDYAQSLVDHLKTDPAGFSRAEAKQVMDEQGDQLQQEVEQALTQQEGEAAFQASRDVVQQQVLEQLNTANRFTPEVNSQYATLTGAFYATQAARLGVTPGALFAQYPLRVQAQSPVGEALEQNGGVPADQNASGVQREADQPDANKQARPAKLTPELMAAGKSLVASVEALAERHGKVYIRWSPTSDRDLTGAQESRDFVSGGAHSGLSAVEITGSTHPIDIAKAISEYGFLRLQDRKNRPRVYLATRTGTDSDGHASIKPSQLLLELDDAAIQAIDAGFADAVDLEDEIQRDEQRLASGIGGSARSIVEQSLASNREKLQRLLNESHAPEEPGVLAQDKRGAFSPGSRTITLLKTADLSTFLHELAHANLEMLADLASQPNAPAEIQQDMQTLLDWFGVKASPEGTALQEWQAMTLEQRREGHEKFARGFEAFLFEGKAPSVELKAIFQRFRSWLVNVYRQLKALNVELTPDVRGVMDRMLATADQIQAAEAGAWMGMLFKTPEEAAQFGVDWAKYHEQGLQATQDAITDLEARGLKDMQWLQNARGRELKRLQKAADSKRRDVRSQVRAEVLAEPVYQAWAFLTAKIEDGADAGRLKTSDLREQYGTADDAVWRQLSALGMTSDSRGTHPEVVAERFAFDSADAMVQALASATPLDQEIEARTDQRMLELYGDITSPEALDRAANEAAHNAARARFVAAELKALEAAQPRWPGTDKKGRPRTVPILPAAAKQFAADLIARQRVRDVRPAQFQAAEARAAKAAQKALAAGDVAGAAREKRNQLINHYAAAAAMDAQREVEKALRYFGRVDGSTSIDLDYRDQIEQLLDRYSLKRESLKDIDRRKSLKDWVDQQRAAGIEPEIPPALLEGIDRKSYRDMTVEELRGLVDTVKQIEHIGRLKHKLLTARDDRTYEAIRDEIAASIETNSGGRTTDPRTPTTNLGRWFQGVRNFGAAHIKAAIWARVLDGGKDGGAMWEHMIRSANERAEQETTMRSEATRRLTEIMAPVLKTKLGGRGTFFPSIGRSLNRESIIAMALNTGNASNLQRLLGGERWTIEQIRPVLDTLSAEDWRAVQSVWDLFEAYRPLIGAKERRVNGIEPKWIDAAPVVTKHGTLRGGYYPVKYDQQASSRAEEHADAEEAREQLRGAYSSATTRRSFTKARVDEVHGRPLLLTMQGLYGGVNEVIHDLAWHEWLIDTNRLMKSDKIDTAIRTTWGPAVVRQFKDWREDIAAGDRGAQKQLEKGLAALRQGISVAGLGYNVMSAMIQPLGLTQSIVRVGAKWIGRGVVQYIASPLQSTRSVQERSEFMRNRSRTQFRELNELRNQIQGQTGVRERLQANAYVLMMKMQQTVDMPTWLGAYEKAMATDGDEARAIALADQAVIDSQGGGQLKDLAAIERGGAATKLFTTFYTFMNTALNLGVAQGLSPQSAGKKAADMLMIFTVPAVLGTLLRGALTPGGDDDDETLVRKLISAQLEFLLGVIVLGREFAAVARIAAGVDGITDYTGPVGLRVVPDTVSFFKQAGQGEFDDAFRKAAINLAGSTLGLPAAQANKTITGAQALAEGETENPAALVFGFQR